MGERKTRLCTFCTTRTTLQLLYNNTCPPLAGPCGDVVAVRLFARCDSGLAFPFDADSLSRVTIRGSLKLVLKKR